MTITNIEYITTECPSGHRVRGDAGWLNHKVHCPHCQKEFVFARPLDQAAKVTAVPEPPPVPHSPVHQSSLSDTSVMRILDEFGKPVLPATDTGTRHCRHCGADYPSDVSVCYGCNIELEAVASEEPAEIDEVAPNAETDESINFEPLSTSPCEDVRIRKLMRPRKEIVFLDVNDTFSNIQHVVRMSPHASYPVCVGTLDGVLGATSLVDVALAKPETFDLRPSLKTAIKLVDETRVSDAILALREQGQPSALVVDDYDTVIGLVTLKQMLVQLLSR